MCIRDRYKVIVYQPRLLWTSSFISGVAGFTVIRLEATDDDAAVTPGGQVKYRFHPGSRDLFSINDTSGIVTVGPSSPLSYTTQSLFNITVRINLKRFLCFLCSLFWQKKTQLHRHLAMSLSNLNRVTIFFHLWNKQGCAEIFRHTLVMFLHYLLKIQTPCTVTLYLDFHGFFSCFQHFTVDV